MSMIELILEIILKSEMMIKSHVSQSKYLFHIIKLCILII